MAAMGRKLPLAPVVEMDGGVVIEPLANSRGVPTALTMQLRRLGFQPGVAHGEIRTVFLFVGVCNDCLSNRDDRHDPEHASAHQGPQACKMGCAALGIGGDSRAFRCIGILFLVVQDGGRAGFDGPLAVAAGNARNFRPACLFRAA
jgi:hypothetical protein